MPTTTVDTFFRGMVNAREHHAYEPGKCQESRPNQYSLGCKFQEFPSLFK